MNKKLLFTNLIGLSLFAAIPGLTSCADDNDADSAKAKTQALAQAKTPTDMADYTFIMISTTGGDLDYSIAKEMLTNYSGFDKKVKFAGIHKPSASTEKAMVAAGMEGTRYFELKLKEGVTTATVAEHLKADSIERDKLFDIPEGKARDAAKELLWEHSDVHFFSDMVGSKYSDISLDLTSPSNIAQIIKTVAERNPAKKYILVTNNHGGGWIVDDDVPMTSRAQVFDDNNKDKYGNNQGITLDELNAGVQNSGVKFEALFCDLCIMAYIENLTGFQQNFKFCIASAESTTGSRVGTLGTRLANAGANITDDQLYSELSSWIQKDEYKNDWRSFKAMATSRFTDAQSMGVYDLRNISSLTTVMKDISDWYIYAYDVPAYKKIINEAVLTSNYISLPHEKHDNWFYDKRLKFIQSDLGSSQEEIVKMIVNNEQSNPVYKKIVNLTNDKESYISTARMRNGITFSHFVRTTLQLLEKSNNTTEAAKLKALYDRYQSTLKSVSSIKCSHSDFSDMDAYVWTSPTITLHSLNKNYFSSKGVVTPVQASKYCYLNQALSAYHNTKFDQETGWSNFLQKLTVSPSVLTNPVRTTAMYDKLAGK